MTPADRPPAPLADSDLANPRGQARRRRRRPLLGDQIRDAIYADFVANGAVPAGARLPSEAELCDRYEVSRITVRAALRSLQQAGLISTRQGQGTTVLPQPETIASGLDRLCSVETYAREEGHDVDSTAIEVEVIKATPQVASRLEIGERTLTLVVRRVKLYGGVPIGWIVDYVHESVLPFSTVISEFRGSVLDVLLEHAELEVDYADCDLEPVVVDEELAARLNVAPGSPALYMDELTRTRTGQTVNWSQAWLLPEHLRFFIRRRHQFTR